MTAVEWLIREIKKDIYTHAKSIREWDKVYNRAKEMEQEQIEDAFCEGVDDEYEHHINNKLRKNSEQYYNETFKNK